MKSLRRCTFGLMVLGVLCMASCNDSNNSGTEVDITPGSDNATSSHAIINGQFADDRIYNGVVSLYMGEYSMCTGTLIHPQWVLTAAHCVADDYGNPRSTNPYIKIALGNTPDELKSHQYNVDYIVFNENYNGLFTTSNDIALIKLSSWIPESVAYPIPPLHPNDSITREQINSNGVEVAFVGFGVNENGNSDYKLKINSYLSDSCGAANGDNINGCYYLPFGTLYYEQYAGGTCYGDSGGPAFIKTQSFPGIAVAGVTSYGDIDCTRYGVDTAVQDFYDSFIMRYAPEVKSYHDNKYFNALNAANDGYCTNDHLDICELTSQYNQGFVACNINEENKSWMCAPYCLKDNPKCIERCSEGAMVCDEEGTGLRTCVDGKWSEPELCPTDTPYCNYNRCRTSAVDCCTFHWMEADTENSTATGYGRIFVPSGNPEDIKNAYMACTDNITKPVSEWTRMDAELNANCSNCGQNFEYMSTTYQASSVNNYCTFVFEYKDEVIACRPQQDGDSEPFAIKPDTTLGVQDIRFFMNE